MSVGACQEADNFASAFTLCRASCQSVVRAWDCLRSLLTVYTGLGMHRAPLIHTALQIPRTGSEFPKAPVAISLLSFSFKAFQLSSASGSHKVKQSLWIFQQTSHSRGKDSLQRQWTSSKLKLNKDSLEMSLPLYRNHYNITQKLLWRNRYTGQITQSSGNEALKEVQPHSAFSGCYTAALPCDCGSFDFWLPWRWTVECVKMPQSLLFLLRVSCFL